MMITGVLGGSGLYDIDGLEDAREEEVSTPVRAAVGRRVVSGRIGEARCCSCRATGAGTASRRRRSTTAPTSSR